MKKITNEELLAFIAKATAGDKDSLETVILSVQDLVFNLSLRMLGTFPDAEDATQDILLKIITHLSSFKGESAFSTWVFRIAGDILGITPEAYRQRLFRIRAKMADFLKEYCGEYGNGTCRCADRVNYAIQNHRIHPAKLDFSSAIPQSTMLEVKEAMESIDDLSQEFAFYKTYQSPAGLKKLIQKFLNGPSYSVVTNA
jgi:hypothetical protein